jgi:RNA-directed DNA polymerase
MLPNDPPIDPATDPLNEPPIEPPIEPLARIQSTSSREALRPSAQNQEFRPLSDEKPGSTFSESGLGASPRDGIADPHTDGPDSGEPKAAAAAPSTVAPNEKRPIEPAALPYPWPELQTAGDVARFFKTSQSNLLYWLYQAPLEQRYTTFEIPKASGGVRTISAPAGMIRTWQEQLGPLLSATYRPHPSAHGFLTARSVVSNARIHAGARHVLNVDLKDFFPSVNFGRVRGLYMKPPFSMGGPAATVLAQLCTLHNGLPQGAPTSPALSNFAAATLDRRLTRLAKSHRLTYSRYADDLSFSTAAEQFPPAVAYVEIDAQAQRRLHLGAALASEITASGFAHNPAKLRLQGRSVRQSVTGLTVNAKENVRRKRVRRLRAMLHAWGKFGLEQAGVEHFGRYRCMSASPGQAGKRFRHVVYGQLSFIKMVRGADDPLFLKLCARVLDLDPNPSTFLRKMVFGDERYDVFISHASEDKDAIARPLHEALARQGVKAFLDEAHIGWGESFTKKINTALGSARTVVAIISASSVNKDWPILELNAALALEASGQKSVLPVIVGKPDLSKLPLIQGKDWYVWKGDPDALARRVRQVVKGELTGAARRVGPPAVPTFDIGAQSVSAAKPVAKKKGLFARLFGLRQPD